MTNKVPATIVTGFLGAGKTTLIRNLIENANGRRLALIINEFGDVGVDGEILRGCGDENCKEEDIVELSNGCLCCTVAEDFIPTLETLLSRTPRPDHIVIETSGLALPKPLVKAFAWPEIRSEVTVDGVVAVVDGPAVANGQFAHDPVKVDAQRKADEALDHDNPLEEVFEDQILCADLVVLNKTDAMDSEQVKSVTDDIRRELAGRVKVVPANHGVLPVEVLLGLTASAEDDLDNRKSHHDHEHDHDHDDFDTFIVDVGEISKPGDLINRAEKAAENHGVLRIKGYVAVEGKPMRLLVQGVGNRFEHRFDRPWQANETRSGRLVVIGEHGINRAEIERTLLGS
ncbi:MAG: cobalamin biosynthesis protein CobW [Hyphomicrobiaceae bacterium]